VDSQGTIMPNETTNSSPQEQLAQEITDALIESKLVAADKRKRLQKKIAAGELKAEDWSLMIELAAGQNGNLENDGVKNAG